MRAGLYLGFAATGVGAAMPGALLPLLMPRWNLGDARGGLLLFCYFLANTVGALASRGAMNRSLARGALLTAAGAVWLGVASRAWGFGAMAVYGLGLGIAMTSTSLLVSRRFPAERRVEMMRLNLLWAAGACAGPWLGLGGRALRVGGSSMRPLHVLLGIAAFFAAWAMWTWAAEGFRATVADVVEEGSGLSVQGSEGSSGLKVSADRSGRWMLLAIPLPLLVLVFCATGVESSTGGWLAAYAHRVGETVGTTIGAATAFWVGLLSSRVVHSVRWMERMGERMVLTMSTVLMVAGLAVLVAWPSGTSGIAAALVVGFGAGPVYPLLLAMVLRKRETRGIFVLAGCGAAALPLMTGAVSGWIHSLAAGLGAPLAAAAVMMVLSWRVVARTHLSAR
ncbi:MAG TPA: MFS transporter [Acidobacteriaceae bacterium]